MSKVKKGLLTAILLLLTIVTCLSFAACGKGESDAERNGKTAVGNEEVTPYGLYTDLQFSLNGENGLVYASVKNKFTLFPSTVTVNVELYRSQSFQENVANMTLAASNYIYDLDQGETLTATASTEGRQSYWKAKASYRVDNGAWKQEFSNTVFLDKNGIRTAEPAPEPDDKEYFVSDFLQIDAEKVNLNIPCPPLFPYSKNFPYVPHRVEFVLTNEDQMSTVKNLFGKIKLDKFDTETKTQKEQTMFYGAYSDPKFSMDIKFDDAKQIFICVNDWYLEEFGANLFVQYIYKENGNTIYKNFMGLISDEAINALLEVVNEICYEQCGKAEISNTEYIKLKQGEK